jgi:hypothetical protein
MFGSDWLANLFLSFFLFGLLFTIASVALGFVSGGDAGHAHGHAGGHAGHADAGGGHHVHVPLPGQHDVDIHVGGHSHDVEHAGSHDGPSIFNMPTIMAFITWFGGVGYLLRQDLALNGYVASVLALVSGVIGGGLMFVLLARVLWPMMSKPLENKDYHLPGTSARVVSPIREGGVGEIIYSKDGYRFTAGARSIDESAIARGVEVVIIKYEKGLAYVQDVGTLLGEKA